jgi:hypothetical protein
MSRRTVVPVMALFVLAGLTSCADTSSPATDVPVEAPNTLEVECDGSTTSVTTEAVQAKADGVHVIVHNASAEKLLVGWDGGGDGADPGETRLVFPVPPGDGKIRCQRPSEDPGSPEGWATFSVVAPPDWVSPTLVCPGGSVMGTADYTPGAVGVQDPLADARKRAEGADVSQAGYRTEQNLTIVALQGGVVTEAYGYMSDGHGGWLLSTTSACS